MRAFGYKRGDEESEEPMELKEVTLLCNSVEDLRRLQAFVEKVIAERSADDSIDKGPWHDHLRDRDDRWTDDEADVILYLDK